MGEKIDARIPTSFFEVLILFLSIKGKINFLQLERFSEKCEQSFRYIFERPFNFLSFNKALTKLHIQGKTAIAFDPSYISKSGKKTPSVGYFWSGCAGRAKWGLEFCGLAVLDLSRHTAFHLYGFQTIDIKEDETLVQFYGNKLLAMKQDIKSISKYIIADAYFSKVTFIEPLNLEGFDVVSRFRDDANLQYNFKGEQKGGRGRPKKYDGKVDFQNLNLQHAKLVSKTEKEKIYSFDAYSKSLKGSANIVIVYTQNKAGKWSHKIYFSTDLEQKWDEVLQMYQQRFQIEFLYRDAKQFTGLNDCEARSENKLSFHWNMALTAVNVAKISNWISKKDNNPKENIPFSMSDVKTSYYNDLLLSRFISIFAINTKLDKNKSKIKRLLAFGKISA